MKEYTIYQRHGHAKPFMIHSFPDVLSAKLKINEIVSIEENRGRPYFVDNDFFSNKYSQCGNFYYLCILERDVSDWNKYSESNLQKPEENNIIFLNNFKKKA